MILGITVYKLSDWVYCIRWVRKIAKSTQDTLRK